MSKYKSLDEIINAHQTHAEVPALPEPKIKDGDTIKVGDHAFVYKQTDFEKEPDNSTSEEPGDFNFFDDDVKYHANGRPADIYRPYTQEEVDQILADFKRIVNSPLPDYVDPNSGDKL